ncbi:MAG: AtpZ/AtpI family protein [Balneolaceae bacterium]
MSNTGLPNKYKEYLGLGAEIALTLILPIALGYFLDGYLGVSPWGVLVGSIVGIILFFFTVFRISKKLTNKDGKQ